MASPVNTTLFVACFSPSNQRRKQNREKGLEVRTINQGRKERHLTAIRLTLFVTRNMVAATLVPMPVALREHLNRMLSPSAAINSVPTADLGSVEDCNLIFDEC